MGFQASAYNKNFENERRDFDYYPTCNGFVETAIRRFYRDELLPNYKWGASAPAPQFYVGDVGAGDGLWGTACRHILRCYGPHLHITGIEIQPEFEKPAAYDEWYTTDYFNYQQTKEFNLIIGNPPYGRGIIRWIIRAYNHLAPGGWLVWLLKSSVLESQGRYNRFFFRHPPVYVYQLSKRPSFTMGESRGKPDTFSLFCWKKGGEYFNQFGEPESTLRWIPDFENVWQFSWEQS